MKTPDSRPRFKSSARHYHRYREENRDGWSDWVDGKKSSNPARRGPWKWWLFTLLGLAVAGAIGALIYKVS